MHFTRRFWQVVMLAWVLLGLQACSQLPRDSASLAEAGKTAWQPEDQLKWDLVKIPGKVTTQYSVVKLNQQSSLMANALSSASMLRKDLRIEPDQLGQLSFSWHVKKLIENADMAQRDQDDSPVRLVLAFDGDRSLFSAKNAMLSELSHAVSGRPMPRSCMCGATSAPWSRSFSILEQIVFARW